MQNNHFGKEIQESTTLKRMRAVIPQKLINSMNSLQQIMTGRRMMDRRQGKGIFRGKREGDTHVR